jgi:hypothetical protein
MHVTMEAEYHAPIGTSVTGFTVIRSLFLLRVRAAASAIGVKADAARTACHVRL